MKHESQKLFQIFPPLSFARKCKIRRQTKTWKVELLNEMNIKQKSKKKVKTSKEIFLHKELITTKRKLFCESYFVNPVLRMYSSNICRHSFLSFIYISSLSIKTSLLKSRGDLLLRIKYFILEIQMVLSPCAFLENEVSS